MPTRAPGLWCSGRSAGSGRGRLGDGRGDQAVGDGWSFNGIEASMQMQRRGGGEEEDAVYHFCAKWVL